MVAAPSPQRRSLPRGHSRRPRRLPLLGVLLLLGALSLWWLVPTLLAPIEPFAQGPSAVVAYVSLWNQLQAQASPFWAGQEIQIHLNDEEFSGMLSSALLSGKRPANPLEKVRGQLLGSQVGVEAVLRLPTAKLPSAWQGPIGLRVGLAPDGVEGGQVRFRIDSVQAGRLPIPLGLVRWAAQFAPQPPTGIDLQAGTIALPVSDLVSQSLGRPLAVKSVAVVDGQLQIAIAMEPPY